MKTTIDMLQETISQKSQSVSNRGVNGQDYEGIPFTRWSSVSGCLADLLVL